MILGVYAVRDVKTCFLTPTVDQNDSAAIRNFEHAMSNQSSLFFTHASDFDLYKIANFDTDTAKLVPCEPIKMICSGSSFAGKE